MNDTTVLESDALAPESVEVEQLADCSAEYQHHLKRLLSMQAYAERNGATELSLWIPKAPDFRVRRLLARIMADEADHSFRLYAVLHDMGVSEDDAIAIAQGRSGGGPTKAALEGPVEVGNPDNSWDDIVLSTMFLDRAGRFMVENFSMSSYAPWAKACKRILKDEYFHQGFGLKQFQIRLGSEPDRDAWRSKVTKWYAHGLNFFGPPGSSKTELLRSMGLKRKSNEELREGYRQEVEELMASIGASDLIALSNNAYPYA